MPAALYLIHSDNDIHGKPVKVFPLIWFGYLRWWIEDCSIISVLLHLYLCTGLFKCSQRQWKNAACDLWGPALYLFIMITEQLNQWYIHTDLDPLFCGTVTFHKSDTHITWAGQVRMKSFLDAHHQQCNVSVPLSSPLYNCSLYKSQQAGYMPGTDSDSVERKVGYTYH